MDKMFPEVTVILPVRNEEAHIEETLQCLLAQDYPKDKLEIIVADGESTDQTRAIVETYQPRFFRLILLCNSGRIVSTGLNQAIGIAGGEIILRLDGHLQVESDYVRTCVEMLQVEGATNAGGIFVHTGQGGLSSLIAAAMESPFGVGGAAFRCRKGSGMEWVDTVPMGAWRREVFAEHGLFDESLVRNQDEEFNYRIRKKGGKILMNRALEIRYMVRKDVLGLARQYFQYGFWKVRVLQKHPLQMQMRHFIPFAFVVSLLVLMMGALAGQVLARVAFFLLLTFYGVAALYFSYETSRRFKSWRAMVGLPMIYATLHLSYGCGFSAGLLFLFLTPWKSPKVSPLKKDVVQENRRLQEVYEKRDASLPGNRSRYGRFGPAFKLERESRTRLIRLRLIESGRLGRTGLRVLEIGCGGGAALEDIQKTGIKNAAVYGMDLLKRRMRPQDGRLLFCGDAKKIPCPDHCFDIVFQFTLLSSVLDADVRAKIAKEMIRVVKKDGLIFSYDFWINPFNRNTAGISPKELRKIFPGCGIRLDRVTLAPPLARVLAGYSPKFCQAMENMKILNTHYLALIQPDKT